MKITKLQIVLLSAATLLIVLLFLIPTKPSLEEVKIQASVDAKIDSAIAMVNSGSPMQGIFLLRELSEEHPDNMRIQLNLGMFSVQSGQIDKAEARFQTVLKNVPNQPEALYFMGYIEAGKGNKEQALDYLQKALEFAQDDALKQDIEQYLKELNS